VDVQKYERQSCREEEEEEEADDESVSSRSLLLLQSFCYAIAREKLHGITVLGFFPDKYVHKNYSVIFLNHSLEWC
jgi:hypothetical protein